MAIRFDPSSLRQTRWYEYAVRFLFGGAVTAATGLLARHYGPVVGGLFLAFPAIFPAGATLIESHEREKKRRAGIHETKRGRQAVALDARGAALGAVGLACFGLVAWKGLPDWNAVLVLLLALAAWLVVSVLAWRLVRLLRHRTLRRRVHSPRAAGWPRKSRR